MCVRSESSLGLGSRKTGEDLQLISPTSDHVFDELL